MSPAKTSAGTGEVDPVSGQPAAPRPYAEATPPSEPSHQGPCRKGKSGDPSSPPPTSPPGTQHWVHDHGSPPGHDSSLSDRVSLPGMILCLWLCVCCCDTHVSPAGGRHLRVQSHLGPRDPETLGVCGEHCAPEWAERRLGDRVTVHAVATTLSSLQKPVSPRAVLRGPPCQDGSSLPRLNSVRSASISEGTTVCPRAILSVLSKGQLPCVQEDKGQAGGPVPARPQSLIEHLLCARRFTRAVTSGSPASGGGRRAAEHLPTLPAITVSLFMWPWQKAKDVALGGWGGVPGRCMAVR